MPGSALGPEDARGALQSRAGRAVRSGIDYRGVGTLPETTPVSQAAALQEDLRRAKIEPFAWVINKSVLAAGTHDPLLRVRLAGEVNQQQRIANGLAKKTFVLPWLAQPPVGVEALSKLVIRPV
jgi:arsenite-transporting ATPase